MVEDESLIDKVEDVMERRMEKDERVVVIGEDVNRIKGGKNGEKRGIQEDYKESVMGKKI